MGTARLRAALSAFLFASFGAPVRAQDTPFPKVFGELRRLSDERAPDLLGARALREQKGGARWTAWTRALPNLNLQASRTRSKDYSFITGGVIEGPLATAFNTEAIDLYRWQIAANMPIYNRGVHLGISQASAENDLAERQYQLRLDERGWKLRQKLGAYLLAAYRQATARSALESAKTSQRETKLRFDLGQKTKIDVLKAESNQTALEAKLLTADQEVIGAKNSLIDDSGLSPEELTQTGIDSLLGTEEKINASIAAFTEGTDRMVTSLEPYLGADAAARTQKAVDASLAYRNIRSEEELSLARAGTLRAQEWPDLSVQGTYGKQGTNFRRATSSGERSYSIGVVLNVPLFAGGRFFSSGHESAGAAEAARVKRARDARNFFNELENGALRITALRRSVEANRLRVERDTEVLRLSQKSYQLGKTTTLELLTAQNDLLDSKADFADARIQLAVLARQFAWNLGLNPETP